MKSFNVDCDGTQYLIEQPSSDYNIFYINRKQGTFCISLNQEKKWVVDLQINASSSKIAVEKIGRSIEDHLRLVG